MICEKFEVDIELSNFAVCVDIPICPICKFDMTSDYVTTVCNHTFHLKCIFEQSDKKCPMCDESLEIAPLTK